MNSAFSKKYTVLYFGLFDPNFSRNKVYGDGLKQNGVEVLMCTDKSKGLRKYWQLFKKHWQLRNSYDAMIVGFPGFIVVPFAKLIAKRGKPVYFDALCSFYETQIISRDAYKGNPFRIPYVRIIDWVATRCADTIFVETQQQKNYFVKELGVRADKCVIVYTGVDDSEFYFDPSVKKNDEFTVLFRGRITAEAGAIYVLRAAKLLENRGVQFLIIGFGWADAMKQFDDTMDELKPTNVKHIREQIPFNDLRALMLGCNVSLGQFETNERLKRTIPHKAFESMAMELPYITVRMEGVQEVFSEGTDCLMANPADAKDLAEKILALKQNPEKARSLAENAFTLYQNKFTPKKIVEPIMRLLQSR